MTDLPLYGIVLAGGAAERLSGADKPMLDVGGQPLLRTAIDAVRGAESVVVVGPQRPGIPGVRWARENPPGGGPVAALAAGLAELPVVDADVAILAADLPGVTAATVDRLRAAKAHADGAVLIDENGRRQWLIGVWRLPSLRAAMPEHPAGVSVRAALGELMVVEVAAEPGEAADIDTPDDLEQHSEPPGGSPAKHHHQ